MNMMNCPNCGNQMRPTPVVWKQGASVGGSTTFGAGYANGSFVPFAAETSSQSQTRFAAELVPPETYEIGCGSVLLFLLFLLFSLFAVGYGLIRFAYGYVGIGHLFIFFVLSLVLCMVSIYIAHDWWRDHLWNKNVYPKKYAAWKNSQVCMNCGYRQVMPLQNQAVPPVYSPNQDQMEPPIQPRRAKLRVPPPPPNLL